MNLLQKIKNFLDAVSTFKYIDQIFWALIIMCVALGFFSLGAYYQSTQFLRTHPIEIEVNKESLLLWDEYHQIKNQDIVYFGSRNGSTVYPADCNAGNRILEENKIYFNTLDEADSLGYSLSTRC